MKIINLKLGSSTIDMLVPIKKELIVEDTNASSNISLKKDKNVYNKKRISKFDELLRKEMDKLK